METVTFKPSEESRQAIERLFESEKARLLKLFPEADVQEIGSTAVPGLITKGDLDINIRIDKESFGPVVSKLKELYQINQPDNWTETYASFKAVIDGIDFGLQVSVIGSPDDYFVQHRDLLKNRPDLVERYNQLKRDFEGKDMDEYRKAKEEFFQNHETHNS